MSTPVEKVSSIGRKISVAVPADQVESAIQGRLKQLSKRVKIQGFRPGKVPMKIVEQQYRGTAINDVLPELIEGSLQKALIEADVVPAVQPDVIPNALEKGQEFTFTATFDVYPEFGKLDLDGIKVKKPVSEVQDADVDRVIENMRKQQLTWKDIKRKSKKGDRATIDYVGSIDGEEFDGGKAQDHAFVIGEGQMLADFEDGVKGMKAGDEGDINVTFPDDYNEDLGGKTAVFKITVKSIAESELPEVNEDFVKSFGIEGGKVEDLRAEVQSNLETNLESQLSTMIRQRAFDALLEQNEVELPLKMVQSEASRMVQEQKNQIIQQGIDPKMLENMPDPEFETLRPQAEKRVSLGLLMMEVVRANDLKPDVALVDAKLQKMASSYEDSDGFINYYKNNQEALAQVESLVLEEQVVDLLLSKAKTSDEKIKAADILNMQ